MTTNNAGHVALVTGGGTGIGRATARQLADAGWSVLVDGRREVPLAEITAADAAALPLKRRGTADEVARWIVALADPVSAWVTCQVIAVDGGMAVV
jgi:NAD(P)-dependent dehydrogenase (short-subunit alcohol dehydrogenase family)